MKVIFSYPPLDTSKGYPTLGQNRQFQYFSHPTYIYPVVPAIAATMLRDEGHDVLWNDCAAEGMARKEYFELLTREEPDLIVFETKTPVIEEHWRLIGEVKKLAAGDWHPSIALVGDHVTALPEESLEKSKVDFVLTGGDYDFLLANLCSNLVLRDTRCEIQDAVFLEPGIWYRESGKVKNTGSFKIAHDLDSAPCIDRELTKWELYAEKNGNYRRTPGTYLMSGRDCWWGGCTFCSWTKLYPRYRVRSVGNVLDEIGRIIERYPIREIMDDTGTFPRGEWLKDFCTGMLERGYNRRVGLDCNFRFGAAGRDEYRLMKKAGFGFLLFGLESANQETLDRVNKGLTVQEIIDSCRAAREAGLYPHITLMFGYPWESYEQAGKTFELGKHLLKKGYAYTMQATIVVPYPGTPLYRECLENGWLTTRDWSDFDMKRPVMRVPFPAWELMKLVRGLYSVAFHPSFLARKVLGIRGMDDLAYFLRAGKRVLGHRRDFKERTQ